MGRAKGGKVISTCRLCLKESELRASHIIPEFMWKPVYDEKIHRIFSVDTSAPKKSKMIQKGIYEKMLCQNCETQLSKLEQYASQIMNHRIGQPTYDNKTRVLTFHNVDYVKFKLFQLSILWKSSVAKDSRFRNVKLGPHEEIIREMLVNNDPGKSHQYGCAMVGLDSRAGISMDRVIVGPLMRRKRGHVSYYFVFARCLWIYVVSSHSNTLKKEGMFLLENGQLPVAIRDAEDIGLLDYIYKSFKEADLLSGTEDL